MLTSAKQFHFNIGSRQFRDLTDVSNGTFFQVKEIKQQAFVGRKLLQYTGNYLLPVFPFQNSGRTIHLRSVAIASS